VSEQEGRTIFAENFAIFQCQDDILASLKIFCAVSDFDSCEIT
jgi:hypothetical protein